MSVNTLHSDALEKELSDLDENMSEEDEEEEEETKMAQPAALFGPGVDMLWEKKKKRKGRTGLTAGKKLPEAVSSLLGRAHEAYINGDYVSAVQLFSEVTQLAPKLPDPYSSMGLIHEEVGDRTSALRLYVVAAKLTPRAHDIWYKIACMAFDLRDIPIALLAITRVMSQDKTVDIFTKKIILLVESRNIKGAEVTLAKMLYQHPAEWEFLLEFGLTCQKNNYMAQASTAYTRYIDHAVTALQNLHVQHARRSNDANAAVHQSAVNAEMDLCNMLFYTCRQLGELVLCLPPVNEFSQSIFTARELISCINSCCECARGCGLLASTEQASSATTRQGSMVVPMDVALISCACEMEEILVASEVSPGVGSSSEYARQSLYHCSLLDALIQHDDREQDDLLLLSASSDVERRRDFRGIDGILRVLFPLLAKLSMEEAEVNAALSAAKVRHPQEGFDAAAWISAKALATAHGDLAEVPSAHEDLSFENTMSTESSSSAPQQSRAESLPLSRPVRELSDWVLFLRARMWVASLLLELGLYRKGLAVSRDVAQSPFLQSALLTEHTVAELLKRHCVHLMYAITHAPVSASPVDILSHCDEVMQTCMLVLQHTPSDSEILIIFSKFCHKYKPDLMANALDMLHVHFLTLLTHFESVSSSIKDKAAFMSCISNSDMANISLEVITAGSVVGAVDGEEMGSKISLSDGLQKYVHSVIDAASKEGKDKDDVEGEEEEEEEEEDGECTHQEEQEGEEAEDEEGQGDKQDTARRKECDFDEGGNRIASYEVDVCGELRALVHWAQLLLDVNGDEVGFCGLMLPFLDVCHQHESERRSGHARKKRIGSVGVLSMWAKRSVLEYAPYEWMDNLQNSLSRMVHAFCLNVPHMSLVLSKEAMAILAGQVEARLKEVSPDESHAVSHRPYLGLTTGPARGRLCPCRRMQWKVDSRQQKARKESRGGMEGSLLRDAGRLSLKVKNLVARGRRPRTKACTRCEICETLRRPMLW
jgi:tetratricopeptide (TPR) repeat protein